VALLACAVQAAGQDEPLVSLAGLGGPFSTGSTENRWVLRTFTVRNTSDEDRTVRVVWVAQNRGGAQLRFFRVVDVPAGSVRLATVAVRPERLRRTGKVGGGYEKVVRITELLDERTGEVLPNQHQEIDAHNDVPAERTVLGVVQDAHWTEENEAHRSLLDNSGLGDDDRARLGTGRNVRTLPDRWLGWEMADVLFVGPLPPARMRPAQVRALLDWVRRGGRVVLTGSAVLPEMLRGPWGEAAGVAACEVHRTGFLQARRPSGEPLETIRLHHVVPIVELGPRDAEVLWRANGLPLLTRRTFGDGTVFTLATPAMALRDPRLADICHEILAPARRRSPLDAGRFAALGLEWDRTSEAAGAHAAEAEGEPDGARGLLDEIAGRRPPARWLPLAILGVLGAAALAGGVVLRLRGRAELLWLALVPAALVLAAGLSYGARFRRGAERVRYVALVTADGEGRARSQQLVAYGSGPATRNLTFSAVEPNGVIRELRTARGATATLHVRTGPTLSVPDLRVYGGSISKLFSDAMVASPAGGTFGFTAAGARLELTNRLDVDITGAVVLAERFTYPVGQIPAGQTRTLTVTPEQFEEVWFEPMAQPGGEEGDVFGRGGPLKVHGEFTGPGPWRVLRNRLVRELLVQPPAAIRTRPVLIGYAAHMPQDVVGRAHLDRQGWSMLVCPLRAAPAEAGEVLVPPGFAHVYATEPGRPLLDTLATGDGEGLGSRSWGLNIRPPDGLGPLDDARATVTVRARAPGYRLRLYEGIRPGRRPVSEIENLTGQPRQIELSLPPRDPRRGTYGLRLEIVPQRDDVPLEEQSNWSLKSVRVELKGTVRGAER